MLKRKNVNNGFTLAEVLITLGIIGIVAAMTMPVLTANYRKSIVAARLKKFNSMMEQALKDSERDHGSIEDWSNSGMIFDENGNYNATANSDISDAFFRTYLAPYIKYISAEKDPSFTYYNGWQYVPF